MTDIKQACAAFVKAQRSFAPALKTSLNPHFKNLYVDLAGCVEAVIDALNNNGLALQQFSHERAGGVAVETKLIHESGEVIECGVLFVPANKQDAQGYGSALTYARRYSLMAACGIAPEDDDGNKAVESKRNKLSNNSNDKNAEFEKKLAGWKANRFSPAHIENLAKQHGIMFTAEQLARINQELIEFEEAPF